MSDFDDINDLLDEFPHLRGFSRLVDLLVNMPWFAALGNPSNADQVSAARDYADALGFPYVEPVFMDDVDDALAAALSSDINTEAWEWEEQARASLSHQVIDLMDEELATMLLTHIAEQATPAIESGARLAAVRQGLSDEDFVTAVIGAGVQAAHQVGLITLAGVDDHAFMARFKLFEEGRWPITIVGSSFLVF